MPGDIRVLGSASLTILHLQLTFVLVNETTVPGIIFVDGSTSKQQELSDF